MCWAVHGWETAQHLNNNNQQNMAKVILELLGLGGEKHCGVPLGISDPVIMRRAVVLRMGV